MIEKLKEQLQKQEEQLMEFQKRFNIRVRGEKDEDEKPEKSEKSAGVLV